MQSISDCITQTRSIFEILMEMVTDLDKHFRYEIIMRTYLWMF